MWGRAQWGGRCEGSQMRWREKTERRVSSEGPVSSRASVVCVGGLV